MLCCVSGWYVLLELDAEDYWRFLPLSDRHTLHWLHKKTPDTTLLHSWITDFEEFHLSISDHPGKLQPHFGALPCLVTLEDVSFIQLTLDILTERYHHIISHVSQGLASVFRLINIDSSTFL